MPPSFPGGDSVLKWHCSACDAPVTLAWLETLNRGLESYPQDALEAIYEGAGSGGASFSTDNEYIILAKGAIIVPTLCCDCFARGVEKWFDAPAPEHEQGPAGTRHEPRRSRGGGRFDDDDDEGAFPDDDSW